MNTFFMDALVNSMVADDERFERLYKDVMDSNSFPYPIEVKSKEDSVVFEIEIPRIDPKEVKVEIKGSILEIEIEKSKIKYKLVDKYDTSKSKLSYDFGVLYITIPVKEDKVIKPITLKL